MLICALARAYTGSLEVALSVSVTELVLCFLKVGVVSLVYIVLHNHEFIMNGLHEDSWESNESST